MLQSEGFFRDEYKNKNEDVDESSNGFTTRAELINKSSGFHANFIPRIDTLSLSKYCPPGNTLTLKFIQSPNICALLAPDNIKSYTITLLDMMLEVIQCLHPEAIVSKLPKKVERFIFPPSNHRSNSSHKKSSCREL